MTERARMFPSTRADIQKLLDETDRNLAKNTEVMEDFGHDGDAMDDRYMWKVQHERELFQAKKEKLEALLSPDTEIVSTAPKQDRIAVGHQVRLNLTLEEGRVEEVTYTIGTKLDTAYNRRKGATIVSNESPVGKALEGLKTGETRSSPRGKIRQVEVLEISPSSLLSED